MSQNFANGSGLTLPVPVAQGGTGVTTSTGTGATVLGTSPTLTTPNIVGVTTASSATAGSVGEFVDSGLITNFPFSVTTTVYNMTSISLTAGDWDVTGVICTTLQASTTVALAASVSLTSATLATRGQTNYAIQSYNGVGVTGIGDYQANMLLRVNVSVTTTVYLVGNASFTGANPLVSGQLVARRRR